MPSRPCPFILLLALFLTLTSPTTAENAIYYCQLRRPFRMSVNGSPVGCANAIILGFPSDISPGLFHTAPNPTDPFSLPKTAIFGDCEIRVDLIPGRGHPVEASWPYLWTLAQTLSTACSYWPSDAPSLGRTGGWIVGGSGQALRITMGGKGKLGEIGNLGGGLLGGAGNLTEVVVE